MAYRQAQVHDDYRQGQGQSELDRLAQGQSELDYASGEDAYGDGQYDEQPASRTKGAGSSRCAWCCAFGGWTCGAATLGVLLYLQYLPPSQPSSRLSKAASMPSAANKLNCYPVWLPHMLPGGSLTTPPPGSTGVMDTMESKMSDMMDSMGIEESVQTGTTTPIAGVVAAPPTIPSAIPPVATTPPAGAPQMATTASQTAPLSRRLTGTTTVTTCVPVNAESHPYAQVVPVGIPGKACTNPADIATYQSMGMVGFHTVMAECAKKCMGFPSCVATCHREKLGFSSDCAGCFGNVPSCTMMHCPFQCATDNAACGRCSTASCMPEFEKCAGLNPDNATEFHAAAVGPNVNQTIAGTLGVNAASTLFSASPSLDGAAQRLDLTAVAFAAACFAAVCASVTFLATARRVTSRSMSREWEAHSSSDDPAEVAEHGQMEAAHFDDHGQVEVGMLTRIASRLAQ